jgi:hypothetical protein
MEQIALVAPPQQTNTNANNQDKNKANVDNFLQSYAAAMLRRQLMVMNPF